MFVDKVWLSPVHQVTSILDGLDSPPHNLHPMPVFSVAFEVQSKGLEVCVLSQTCNLHLPFNQLYPQSWG